MPVCREINALAYIGLETLHLPGKRLYIDLDKVDFFVQLPIVSSVRVNFFNCKSVYFLLVSNVYAKYNLLNEAGCFIKCFGILNYNSFLVFDSFSSFIKSFLDSF